MQLFDFNFYKGSVWIVGAGPGDPGLLSLLAYKSIKKADVIFYDALLNEEILSLAKPSSQLIYVGKRGNKKSINQLEINKLLINEAKKNKRVLRLKGGDPFIFGRGGEEALSLRLNKIPYKIVPGATAGIAGLAYAGIPATHRGFNTSITFISAYGAGGEKPETIDWKSFCKTSQLVVIYMGLKRLTWVCSELIKRGRNNNEWISPPNKNIYFSHLELSPGGQVHSIHAFPLGSGDLFFVLRPYFLTTTRIQKNSIHHYRRAPSST